MKGKFLGLQLNEKIDSAEEANNIISKTAWICIAFGVLGLVIGVWLLKSDIGLHDLGGEAIVTGVLIVLFSSLLGYKRNKFSAVLLLSFATITFIFDLYGMLRGEGAVSVVSIFLLLLSIRSYRAVDFLIKNKNQSEKHIPTDAEKLFPIIILLAILCLFVSIF